MIKKSNRFLKSAAPTCLFLLLTSCSTTPDSQKTIEPICADASKREINQCFEKPENAPSKLARLYVFRPNFGSSHIEERPILTIDDKFEIVLGQSSYATFDLTSGKHHFKISPGEDGSDFWNMEDDVELESSQRYYLAIWNIDPINHRSFASKFGMALLTSILTHGYGATTGESQNNTLNTNAKHELVDEQNALDSIRMCALSKPIKPEDGKRNQ